MPKDYKGDKNPNWKGGISRKKFVCKECGKNFYGHHSRNAKFCSLQCKGNFQKRLKKEKSPRWQGGIREKKCIGCGKTIKWQTPKPYSTFLKQKYCSKKCADKNIKRYRGEDHPNWNGGTQPRDMTKQAKWSQKIFKRDNYTCQWCGKRGGDIQAHHIKSFTYFPDLRWKLKNGITLCKSCHYKAHKNTFYGNQYTGSMEKGG